MKKTRKMLSLILAVLMICMCAPLGGFVGLEFAPKASALEYKEDIFSYFVTNNEAKISYCEKEATGNIIIPDTLGGYPVTTIGIAAFKSCSNITSVSIPESVRQICDSAFMYCFSMEKIYIPNNVTSIDKYAFYECTALTEIELPKGLTNIGDYAFQDCDSLKEIKVPELVSQIGRGAFSRCDNLQNILVDEDNLYFSNDEDGILYNKDQTVLLQFPNGYDKNNFTISNKATTIAIDAFIGCNLENAVIPDSVAIIEHGAFGGCQKLKSIVIPDTVIYLGDGAFSACSSLESVFIGNGIKSIENTTFGNCPVLKDVKIGNRVEKIGVSAFANCYALNRIIIPESVTHLSNAVFYCCYNLAYTEIRNSECEFTVNPFYGTTGKLYSHYGSTTEAFAKENSFSFDHFRPCPVIELVSPDCIHDGKKTYGCDCGFEYEEILPNFGGHVFTEWYMTKEPTVFTDGEEERICTVCALTENRAIGRTEIPDPESGVHIIFPDHTFDEDVQVTANHINNGDLYDKIQDFNTEHVEVFDVNVYNMNGDKVQPNGKILIKIPVPQGFDAKNCSAYYIPETGKPQRVQSYYEDGYIYLETDHFSCYAIVDETPENPSENCSCMCHRGGFMGFIYKIFRFLWKIFGINKTCECGVNHY